MRRFDLRSKAIVARLQVHAQEIARGLRAQAVADAVEARDVRGGLGQAQSVVG